MPMTRRNFIKFSAATGLSLTALNYSRVYGANEKLNHGSVGVGGMGWGDLNNFMGHPKCHIAAICDVDKNNVNNAGNKAKDARKYADWREMLDKEGDKIDSISASIPDHMHAIVALSAMNRKKHVYCQKPLTHDVCESRLLAETAKKMGVITQLGTQHASGIGDRMAVQWLREGVIGKVKSAYLCSNRPGAVEGYRLKGPRPAKGETPPPHLNWDLWIGTAPERPFANGIYHQTKWRAWLDFGTGWSGDIGCHIFDAVWKGLGLTAPKTVVAEVQKSWKDDPTRRADTWPQGDHITWLFPGNNLTAGDITLEWFDGEFYPPENIRKMATNMNNYPAESLFVLGEKGGLLLPHGSGPHLYPIEQFKGTPRPKLGGRNHYHHWIDACLGGEMCESHFVQTGPMAETILLGTVAIRCPDQKLTWDPVGMKVTNSPEATGLLRRKYRDGWKVMA